VLAFVRRVLPRPPLRVLEVGCGRGELAAELLAAGYEVTALDADPEAVAAAREAGVPAVLADFLEAGAGVHDAVLFTRSLHHIGDLDRAAALGVAACRPGGHVVVDEFARERADGPTAAWFYDLRAVLAAAGLADDHPDAPAAADPAERWALEYGGRRLHTGAAIEAALAAHLTVELVERCPHLYRHFAQRLEPTERGAAVARSLLERERERLERGELAATGLRLACRRPT
jgi:2-polyprenyl-3-methyl-5-hydroxy-6-metoxy-1,4-benzoquinol methylase